MKKFISILISLSGFLVLPAFSQNDSIDTRYAVADTLGDNIRLFDSNELLEISLRFDITYFKKKKPVEEYLDAILTYHTSEKDSVNKEIKVRSRGESRLSICDFPPLLLNFKMNDSTGGEFNSINKLKMVTYCKAGNEESILKEYLIYKLYNALTDNSYRVRLLRVNYINTSKESKPVRTFAFVIEPTEVLAKRLNSVEVTSTNLTQKNIKPEMMDRVAIFNYMIGNTDWAVPSNHNILILAQGNADRPNLGMIVPFDFDFSGLVNTDYAAPAEGLGIESVRDRIYIGICRSEEVFLNALQEFSNKKEEFYKVIEEFPYLGERSKKSMISYLDGFFIGFDKRNSIVNSLLNNCKNF
jgi:hypothetical protein